jgi:hypothetical protein
MKVLKSAETTWGLPVGPIWEHKGLPYLHLQHVVRCLPRLLGAEEHMGAQKVKLVL